MARAVTTSRLKQNGARASSGPKSAPTPRELQQEEVMRDLLQNRFAEATGGHHAPERFDSAAARLYATAEDPGITADQDRNIRRLMQRIKQYISVPLVTSHEEPDPHFGRIVITTLVYGEYGEWKIANHTDPRISNPPATLPPRTVTIHLCWGVGYAGVAQIIRPDKKSKARVSMASILQAVAALLLDDWRNALRLMPVKFHVHRARPNPVEKKLAKGGRRWRNRAEGTAPPADVISLFFERSDHVDVSKAIDWQVEASWKGGGNHRLSPQWWCGCLLERDLEEFGFVKNVQLDQEGEPSERRPSLVSAVWKSHESTLPEALTHLIVINDSAGMGDFFRIKRKSGREGETVLEPISHLRHAPKSQDSSFLSLRRAALNLVLDELWARMT